MEPGEAQYACAFIGQVVSVLVSTRSTLNCVFSSDGGLWTPKLHYELVGFKRSRVRATHSTVHYFKSSPVKMEQHQILQ